MQNRSSETPHTELRLPAKRRLVRRRHAVVYTCLRPFFRLVLRWKYGYRGFRFQGETRGQPYLVLANHNGAIDPFMMAVSFRRPIYFVASDHIFRLGWVSRLIRWLVAPIPIVKSMIDTRSIRDILTVLREGGTVGLFPSGNRSFTGSEMPIPRSTAKLVKHVRVPVVLYRYDHGYLATPRWSRYSRKGRVTGRVVRVLEPDEIAAMSPEAIQALLAETLQGEPVSGRPAVRFRGRRLAEYLERVLFVCPACLGLDTLRSRDDLFTCPCGFESRYREDGRLETLSSGTPRADGTSLPVLPDVDAFDRFQQAHLARLVRDPEDRAFRMEHPYFSDDNQKLVRTERAIRSTDVRHGTLRLFADRLVFESPESSRVFPIATLGDVHVHGPQTLQFHDHREDAVYEVRSDRPRSAYKYMLAITALRTPDPTPTET